MRREDYAIILNKKDNVAIAKRDYRVPKNQYLYQYGYPFAKSLGIKQDDLISLENTTNEIPKVNQNNFIEPKLTDLVKNYGAKGLIHFYVTAEGLKSPILKFLNENEQKELIKNFKAQENDLLLIVGGDANLVCESLGNLRLALAKKLDLLKDELSFIWVTDFPLLEYDEEKRGEILWNRVVHNLCTTETSIL